MTNLPKHIADERDRLARDYHEHLNKDSYGHGAQIGFREGFDKAWELAQKELEEAREVILNCDCARADRDKWLEKYE